MNGIVNAAVDGVVNGIVRDVVTRRERHLDEPHPGRLAVWPPAPFAAAPLREASQGRW